MGRHCCVKGCYNKQSSVLNISLFKAPKCTEGLNKWSELLNSKITSNSYVCEEHFNICDVKSAEIVRDAVGNVIYKYEFKKKVLAKGAVPLKPVNTLMDEESEKAPEKIMKITCTETTKTEEVPSKEREVEEVAGTCSSFKGILQNEVEFQDAGSTLAEITDMHENLYDTIVQHKVEVKLPTAEWGFHCSINKKLIIFSVLEIFADPFGNENEVIPMYTKQVIINNFSEVQLHFLGKNMLECTQRNPVSVEELENLLLEIDALKICTGGPSKKYYKSIRLECASRNEISWRHNKCPLIIASGSICKHCASLHNILVQNLNRRKNLNKRRIRIPASPTIKSKIKNISNRRRVVQQHLNRKETSFNRVSKELTKVHERFINIKENVLDEEIKKLSSKLPQNQLFSNSVADGLQYYLQVERREKPETKVFEGCEATIHFTKQINDLFDALNRSFPLEGIRPGSEDLEVIKKAITWLDDWEKNKTREEEFLTASTSQGPRVTLLSTLHLCNELLSLFDFKYILTSKMNQDCLEKFFGIIRQAGCQNDHPTFTSFMQLYHLLSIYKILKPPKFGNCTVREFTEEERPSITFTEFKNIFKEKNMSHKQVHIGNLKKKLDHLIEFTEWECDEIIEHDYEMDKVMSCILYYITGYICRKMLKITMCEPCRSAFISRYENTLSDCPESELVTVKSRGGLIHPNIHLVQIFKKIEISFQNHLNSTNVYELVINDLHENSEKFSFPCIKHKEYTVAYCIHYYLILRMRQVARIKNREHCSKSKEKKKTAKLYNK